MLPKLRQIEEEEPELHIVWNEELQEILKRAAKNQGCDYEQELTHDIYDQLDYFMSDIPNREFVLTETEYKLLYTIFVCEFDDFIRWTNYYFTGFATIVLAHTLLHSMNMDDELKMNRNYYLLCEKLAQFCVIQVQMIEEHIKEGSAEEKSWYQVLAGYFASEKVWISWFLDKETNNDIEDILDETSEAHQFLSILESFLSSLNSSKDEDNLLRALLRNRFILVPIFIL